MILTKKRLEFAARRSKRMAKVGIELETTVERYLKELQDQELIASFIRHGHFSKEDCGGKDFSVTMIINGNITEKSFGVTISIRSWNEAKMAHPKIPQLCFPIGTKKETIVRRILGLFAL